MKSQHKNKHFQIRISEEDAQIIDFLKNEKNINVSNAFRTFLRKVYFQELEHNIDYEKIKNDIFKQNLLS